MRVLRAAGEFPSFNDLTAPEGAALRAENVVVDMPNEWTTHRGMESTAAWVGNPISAVTMYEDTLIAHSEQTGKLAYYSGGTWNEYAGTYNAPEGEVMAFQPFAASLFFTTSAGLYRLDGVSGTPVASGLPQALPGTASTTGSSGFLLEGEATAYRFHWAVNVADGGEGRLVEGAPAPRLTVTNPTGSGGSRDVALSVPIPDGLPTGAFLRVFRADSVEESITPTDEVRQVYERAPTEAELTASTFTFTDSTPDAVKGPSAYYSANTGDGLAQSNYPAPLCRNLAEYQNGTLGICATGLERLTLNILGVDAISDNQWILFTTEDASYGEMYTAGPGESFPDAFQRFTSGTPSENIRNTVLSLCRAINSRSGGALYAFPLDADDTNPGGFIVQTRSQEASPFYVLTNGNGQAFVPALLERRSVDTLERASGVVTVTFISAGGVPLPFNVDDQINLMESSDPNFPSGVKTVSAATSTTISYVEAGPNSGPTLNSGYVDSIDTAPSSSPGTADNVLVWSKEYEPDHWPLTNLLTVGNPTDTLLWAVPLDRYAFLGSEGGIYRLSGDPTNGFGLVDNGPWSNSSRFLGRRNVAVLGGRGYALANEGIVSWSESSKPEPIDAPIQEEIRRLLATNPQGLAQYGHFVADELNQRLYVFVPENPEDTAATRAHILNGRTGAWTRLTNDFPGMENGTGAPGMAPPAANGKLFIVPASEDGKVLSTRLNAADSDYQGPSGEAIPASVQFVPWFAGEPERFKMWTWTRVFTKSPTSSIQVCFATDWVPNDTCQLLPDQDPTYNTPVPVDDPIRALAWPTIVDGDHLRGRQLSVKVSHAVAQQPFRLLGVEVKHRPYGSGQ